jgi:peroxiredoxin
LFSQPGCRGKAVHLGDHLVTAAFKGEAVDFRLAQQGRQGAAGVSIDTPICAAFARSISTTTSGLSKARSISRKANLPDA